MAPREDVVSSAVAFLQDPSVASSALDKRIAFLRSKNLTQEEVDISLARAGSEPQASNFPPSPPPPNSYRPAQPPPPGYGYNNGYNGYPPWTQQPLEPPRRDWRDWFIMATVTTGIGYGLYNIAQRYVLPHITPPTPPQLAQDKASIDESFNKAFALIDQLSADTAALKTTELERTTKLDTALKETESLLAEVRAANARREGENRILVTEVQGLRELVPKSLEQWKKGEEGRLEEVAEQVSGLKRLLENRVGRSAQQATGYPAATPASTQAPQLQARGSGPVPVAESAGGMTAGDKTSSSDASPSRRGGGVGGKAAIPAWQMAAANKGSSNGGSGSNGSGNVTGSNGNEKVNGDAAESATAW